MKVRINKAHILLPIAGLDGQFGLVDVQKFGNPKNMNFSIVVGYKF